MLALAANTVLWCTPLLTLSVIKLLLPLAAVRRHLDPLLNRIAKNWIACNNALWAVVNPAMTWDVQGAEALQPGGWYLVNANHQSWVDIFVLQKVLNRRIPLLKFFLKQELIYVPVIGLAWWALDFPFMRRHGKAALRRNPALRQQDQQATRRACERFALVPTSVTNFAEDTRFTPAKHQAQGSPYRHLLKPKAGAMALALGALGEKFRALVDVTIVYPDGAPRFWDLLCGRVRRVVVRVRVLEVPAGFAEGDFTADGEYRRAFHRWLDELWREKDAQIDGLLRGT